MQHTVREVVKKLRDEGLDRCSRKGEPSCVQESRQRKRIGTDKQKGTKGRDLRRHCKEDRMEVITWRPLLRERIEDD